MNASFYFLFGESVEFLLDNESGYFIDGYVEDVYIFLIALYISYYAIQLFINILSIKKILMEGKDIYVKKLLVQDIF